ncbi:MAG: TatD family hydrolase [Pseudomonadota bacterium]
MLTDIGANLAHDSFDDDLDDVLDRAANAGVERIVVTGSSIDSNDRAHALAGRYANLYCTAGVHPHHADDYTDTMHATLRQQMSRPAVRAAGECGLDYFRNYATPDAQARAFEHQLALAVEFGLPVFGHQRDAHDDFMAIVKPHLGGVTRIVAHCFTAQRRELEDYLAEDFYIGITGWICDERRGSHLLELVAEIPDDRLLIETDAPYLLPRTLRPKPKSRRCEPAHLKEVARTVAAARGVDEEMIARQTTRNASEFFGFDDAE